MVSITKCTHSCIFLKGILVYGCVYNFIRGIRISYQTSYSYSRLQVFKADATGMYSQKVCLKHGFQVEAEIPYTDLPENIRPAPPHQAVKLMVKLLH